MALTVDAYHSLRKIMTRNIYLLLPRRAIALRVSGGKIMQRRERRSLPYLKCIALILDARARNFSRKSSRLTFAARSEKRVSALNEKRRSLGPRWLHKQREIIKERFYRDNNASANEFPFPRKSASKQFSLGPQGDFSKLDYYILIINIIDTLTHTTTIRNKYNMIDI